MNVEFYTGVDERLDVPMVLPPVPDFVDVGDAAADRRRRRRHRRDAQVVQDFCDGKVARSAPPCSTRSPARWCKCDYVWRRTDRWITFPWSADDPLEA